MQPLCFVYFVRDCLKLPEKFRIPCFILFPDDLGAEFSKVESFLKGHMSGG